MGACDGTTLMTEPPLKNDTVIIQQAYSANNQKHTCLRRKNWTANELVGYAV